MMSALVMAAVLLAQGPGGARIATGVITGDVQSSTGGPAAGVRVSAVPVPVPGAAAGSMALASSAATDSTGRYRLEELPPGNYYIMAGLLDLPTYYPGVTTQSAARVVTVGPGATVPAIIFTLARPSGLRVTGNVTGVPPGAPAGLLRVSLIPSSGEGALDTPVKADGTFEFPKVVPGRYTSRLVTTGTTSTVPVQVTDRDIGGLQLTLGSALLGRVVVDDGSKLPVSTLGIAIGAADPLSLVSLRAQRSTSSPASAAPATTARGGAAATTAVSVRADGYFIAPVAAGDYRVAPAQLPFGYYVKSIAKNPESSLVEVTLTTTLPASEPRGVKVGGRIKGFPNSPGTKWVTLQFTSSTSNALSFTETRVGEASIGADGTFEMLHVPPGSGTLLVLSQTGSPNAALLNAAQTLLTANLATAAPATLTALLGGAPLFQMRVDVGNQDVVLDVTVANLQAVVVPSSFVSGPPLTVTVPAAPGLTVSPPSTIAGGVIGGVPGGVIGGVLGGVPGGLTVSTPSIPSNPFTTLAVTGFRVSGKVSGVTAPRIVALIRAGLTQASANVDVNGVFSFLNVPPGTYSVRLSPEAASAGNEYILFDAIVVQNKDVSDVSLSSPGP